MFTTDRQDRFMGWVMLASAAATMAYLLASLYLAETGRAKKTIVPYRPGVHYVVPAQMDC